MTVFQWNCRGIRCKDKELSLYIDSIETRPAILALQETRGTPRIPGYITYTDPTKMGSAILVENRIAATQHLTAQAGCEHTLVELHTKEISSKNNIFVMSAYCRPSQKQYKFDRVVLDAKKLAGNRPLLILGDFNAPHTLWGYGFQSKRGKALVKTMEDMDITMLNEPGVPTRRGNSASRDTTPDLSWLSGSLDVTWKCEDEDLGSDHSIVTLTIRGPDFRTKLGTAHITDWDKMRTYTQHEVEEETPPDSTYKEWADKQKTSLTNSPRKS